MTLEAAFEDLCTHLQELHEGLIAMRVTIVEDKPLEGDSVLVDLFADTAEELLGWLEEALTAAHEGRQATMYPADVRRAQRALMTAHERVMRIAEQFFSSLVPYERIAGLAQMGRQRGGEWCAWAKSVRTAAYVCQKPLCGLNQSLFRCWQEIVERVDGMSVSVQATTVGVHIPASKNRAMDEEGTTDA
jgi:hypothetical protein